MWIAQLSDPHIRPVGVLYKNILDANAVLTGAVRQINRLNPLPDLVVLTGDVVDEGDPAEYVAARAILAELKPRLLVIPGNHDERSAFRAAFADHVYLPPDGPLHYQDASGPVRVIGVDVTVPGRHHGDFTEEAATWLDTVLAADATRPTVVMMHQPPIVTGIPYLDKYNCRNGGRLARIVSRFPAVERILCGHVHRSMQMRFAGTLLCTAPSTATAIALHAVPDGEPASFIEPPGFLLHHWRPDGGMLTHLVPVGAFPGPFPFA
jgi:3',5'-cyclic AMP phosphodiesterase CpdA